MIDIPEEQRANSKELQLITFPGSPKDIKLIKIIPEQGFGVLLQSKLVAPIGR